MLGVVLSSVKEGCCVGVLTQPVNCGSRSVLKTDLMCYIALKPALGGSLVEKGTSILGALAWAINSCIGRDGETHAIAHCTGKCPGTSCPWVGQRVPGQACVSGWDMPYNFSFSLKNLPKTREVAAVNQTTWCVLAPHL